MHIDNGQKSWISGSALSDLLYLGSERDVALGGLGSDVMAGKGGNDYLMGGPGTGDAEAAARAERRLAA
ncbi:MAG: hypothetical protein ACOZAQ_04610 [Pseudomonadota bacterium]